MESPEATNRGARLAVRGLLLNTFLALVKLVSGFVGHSYALIADGVESLADVFSSAIVWGGLRIAARPADNNHPYGHGKAEPLAALFVAIMLATAAVGISIEAIREIITPHHAPAAFTLAVLAGVFITKEVMFRIVRRAARATDSSAVLADAWHHRADALTSFAAAIGISIALIGGPGYEPADDWAALFAAVIILLNAYWLFWPPIHELMDAEPSEAMIDEVREIASRVLGVHRVEKALARKHGPSYWVDMHIEVDPTMTVRRAHGLAHDVKDAVRAKMPNVQDVLVHVEPSPNADESRKVD